MHSYIHTYIHTDKHSFIHAYGVASISRLLKILGLFCNRALLKRLYSAKETYYFKEPTDCSHPIATCLYTHIHTYIHTHTYTYIHTYIHTHIHHKHILNAYMHTYIYYICRDIIWSH